MKLNVIFKCDHKECKEEKCIDYNIKNISFISVVEKLISFGWQVKLKNGQVLNSYCKKHHKILS